MTLVALGAGERTSDLKLQISKAFLRYGRAVILREVNLIADSRLVNF
jgi:hypothetical protein